jgi:hypothetical protein
MYMFSLQACFAGRRLEMSIFMGEKSLFLDLLAEAGYTAAHAGVRNNGTGRVVRILGRSIARWSG